MFETFVSIVLIFCLVHHRNTTRNAKTPNFPQDAQRCSERFEDGRRCSGMFKTARKIFKDLLENVFGRPEMPKPIDECPDGFNMMLKNAGSLVLLNSFTKDLSAGEAAGAAAAAVPGAGAQLQPTEHPTAISNSQAQILVLRVGKLQTGLPLAACSLHQNPIPTRTNITEFLGGRRFEGCKRPGTRWQVASPDLSPQNRAQPAFEVEGDWACYCKCSINLAIYREGNAGDSGKVF